MSFSPLINQLIQRLTVLPGVGKKSAQRMTFELLERHREGAMLLATALTDAMREVTQCEQCRTFTEQTICNICAHPVRQESGILCVVESPQDIIAIEQGGEFNGTYFVLMGHLSPIDGLGPKEIGLDVLAERLQAGTYQEVILATNPTVEGEATAHYIAQICQEKAIKATRIAHGVPVGGELEYIDSSTLVHAFNGRREI